MSSTTSAIIIDTTEILTVFLDDLNAKQDYDTSDKNWYIVLNITLDVEVEFTIGDELIGKIFDFLSDIVTVTNWSVRELSNSSK